MFSRAITVAATLCAFHCNLANAWTSFSPNCTLPTTSVTYVSAPPIRGSLTILWTALSTLFACIYSALHLIVPPRRPSGKLSWSAWVRHSPIWESLFWALVTLLIPECVIWKAWVDLKDAKLCLSKFERDVNPELDEEKWTLRHFLYANMGGFVLRVAKPSTRDAVEDPKGHAGANDSSGQGADSLDIHSGSTTMRNVTRHGTEQSDQTVRPEFRGSEQSEVDLQTVRHRRECHRPASRSSGDRRQVHTMESASGVTENLVSVKPPIGSIQAALAGPEMQRIYQAWRRKLNCSDSADFSTQPGRFQDGEYTLSASDICRAIGCGLIPPWPPCSADDIIDKSKANVIDKILATCQTLYFVVDMCIRAWTRRAVSPLEVGVAAFVVNSVILYALCWSKPKGIAIPTVITATTANSHFSHVKHILATTLDCIQVCTLMSSPKAGDPLPNDFLPGEYEWNEFGRILSIGASSILIGAVHITGWSLEFPTPADQWLWRTSSLALLLLPAAVLLVWLVGFLIMALITSHHDDLDDGLSFVVGFVATIIYCAARLVLLVEVCRSAFYLPYGSFETTSFSNFPT